MGCLCPRKEERLMAATFLLLQLGPEQLPISSSFLLGQHSSRFITDPVSSMTLVLVTLSISSCVSFFLISCVFQGLCSFHLNCKMHCYKIICNIILLLFKVYRFWNDVFFFILDNFHFLSFSWSALVKECQCHILCIESTFDFVIHFSLVFVLCLLTILFLISLFLSFMSLSCCYFSNLLNW